MQKLKISKIIIVPLLLLFLILTLFAVYYFCFVDIQNKNKNISKLENDMAVSTKRTEYLLSVERSVQSAGNDIEKVNSSVLAKDGEVGLIDLLENTAGQNGLQISIDSLSVDNSYTAMGKTNLTTLDVKATVSGNWSGVYTFLSELESLPFISRIDKFALTSLSDGVSAGKWSGIFEIHILKYK
jgi:hypothetical protein